MTVRFGTVVACALVVGLGGAWDARAQIDLSGIWAPIFHEDQVERIPGPEIGDYLGLPINDALRLRGESWDASILTMEEHTCKPHPSTYGPRGVGNMRLTATYDPTNFQLGSSTRTSSGWSSGARSGWTAVPIHPSSTLTPGRDFPPADGRAVFWWWRRVT